jgi:hypothetical protein
MKKIFGLTVSFWVLGVGFFTFSVLTTETSAVEVLRYNRNARSWVRPFVFLDDSAWEGRDRALPLPSQHRTLRGRPVQDPRDFLLRDQVSRTGGSPNTPALERTAEEVLIGSILPKTAALLKADLGDSSAAPILVFAQVWQGILREMKANLPRLEAELALPAGVRNITFLVAPWDRVPTSDRSFATKWMQASRFSSGQLGFDPAMRTPQRNWSTKHWLADDQGSLSFGLPGNLGNRVREVCERSTAMVQADPFSMTDVYAIPPYAYPVAILANLKIAPGRTQLKMQLLLGLQPLAQRLQSPQRQDGVEFSLVGVPQPRGTTPSDEMRRFPLLLGTINQNLRDDDSQLLMHVEFGDWKQYQPISREFQLDRSHGNWRLGPFFGGKFMKGNVNSYWTHLEIPIRVHLTEFDLNLNLVTQDAQMRNLRTAIDIYDSQPGRLIPYSTRFNLGMTEGQPTDQAARGIQAAVNENLKREFEQARTRARTEATSRFPVVSLFLKNLAEGVRP